MYGENVGPRDVSWDVLPGDPPYEYRVDLRLAEASYRTLPVRDGGHTYYMLIWRNPFPCKRIRSISVNDKGTDSIWVKSIRFI